jgi:hypothetical protein
MIVTVNWLAVGFTCPEKLKKFDPFTFSAVPSKNTNAPVTLLELPTSAVDTPFTTDVPDILSEKSGFCAIVNVTTSRPYTLFVSVPLYVPFTAAMV